MIKQEFNVFTNEEKMFVLIDVLSSQTEWMNAKRLGTDGESDKKWNYYSRTIADKRTQYDHAMMCLRLVNRNKDLEGIPCSPLWDFFEPIFHRVRERMELPFSHILRSSINLTFHSTDLHGAIHKDHYSVGHYNMIFLLSPISQGGTFIFDENHEMLEESSATVWSATAFGGLWHAQGFCAPNETRAALVVTWA